MGLNGSIFASDRVKDATAVVDHECDQVVLFLGVLKIYVRVLIRHEGWGKDNAAVETSHQVNCLLLDNTRKMENE